MPHSTIIAVTGTKGKTTVVGVISSVLRALGKKHVMHGTTTGLYIDGELAMDEKESLRIWGLRLSVSPGRFLYLQKDIPKEEKPVAVFEASIGSGKRAGVGYSKHKVGVFLNVFEDHIGSQGVESRDDIVDAKRFIYARLGRDGWAVINVDDEHVLKAMDMLEIKQTNTNLFFGITTSAEAFFKRFPDDQYLTIEDGVVKYYAHNAVQDILDVRDVVWTFGGTFTPSLYNLLAATAGLIGFYGGALPDGFREAMTETRFDPYGGRLTLLRSHDNVTILADYAHEKYSLREVGKLAKTLVQDNGKVVGVVRLAHDRTDELIRDTGEYIAHDFDHFVVYDKIDGHYRVPREYLPNTKKQFPEVVAKVSTVLADAIRGKNEHVDHILREDEALKKAAEIARSGDVVVHIVNDDIRRSIGFIQESFGADFV